VRRTRRLRRTAARRRLRRTWFLVRVRLRRGILNPVCGSGSPVQQRAVIDESAPTIRSAVAMTRTFATHGPRPVKPMATRRWRAPAMF